MPLSENSKFQVVEKEGKFWVYEEGEDGQPQGSPFSEEGFESREEAEKQQRALYAQAGKKSWTDQFKALLKPVFDLLNQEEELSGFKILNSGYWRAWYSNDLRDLEGERFPREATKAFITGVLAGEVPYPDLWYFHLKALKWGETLWLGQDDHETWAVGQFLDTPYTEELKTFCRDHPHRVSHGFKFLPGLKVGGEYHHYKTFEISPIPVKYGIAANVSTRFEEIRAMPAKVTNEQRKALEAIFGAERAAKVIKEQEEEASKALEGKAPNEGVEEEGKKTPSTEDKEVPTLETRMKAIEDQLKVLDALPDKLKALLEAKRDEEKSKALPELAKLRKDLETVVEYLETTPKGTKSSQTRVLDTEDTDFLAKLKAIIAKGQSEEKKDKGDGKPSDQGEKSLDGVPDLLGVFLPDFGKNNEEGN